MRTTVEHFDESIVLLKHLLCWEYSDLTSLKLNVHDEKSKSTLSDKARKKLKEWLSSDYIMYDHFKEIFEKKIEALGANVGFMSYLKCSNWCQISKWLLNFECLFTFCYLDEANSIIN